MAVRVIVIIIAVVAVLTGSSWRRRGGRRRIAITVVRLLPADLSDAANLLLGVLIHVLLVRLLGLVFVLVIVPVVEIAATATSQYVAIVVVAGRGQSIHRISGGSDRVTGLAALKVILGLGVAAKIIVVHRLEAGTDSIQVEVVAGIIEGRSLAIHVIPVRTGLALLIEGGIVGTQESKCKIIR